MLIEKIQLENFRNHKKTSFEFGKTTIVHGENGQGKTNLIEGIGLVTSARSFRTKQLVHALMHDQAFFRLSGRVLYRNRPSIISFFYDQDTILLTADGKRLKRGRYIGEVPTIFFSPELFGIITGSPSMRRRYFDILFSTIDKTYALNLIEYLKILVQRNRLLSLISQGKLASSQLETWNERFIEASVEIMEQREELIRLLAFYLPKAYQRLSGHEDILHMRHESRITLELFKETLFKNQPLEIERGYSLFGPHTDDVGFYFSDKPVRQVGSRGQIRLLILALKMAEIEVQKMNPLLLLDDPFSELDERRRDLVLSMFERAGQVIVTSNSLSLPRSLLATASLIGL